METLPLLSSPRRHIISSFPYYFYSVPSSPTNGLSSFVAVGESKTCLRTEEFEFSTPLRYHDHQQQAEWIDEPPVMAFDNELPLKLPPCLQQVDDAAGYTQSFVLVGSDPFEAAVEHIRKGVTSRSRKPCRRWARPVELMRNLVKWKPKKTKVFPVKSAEKCHGSAGSREWKDEWAHCDVSSALIEEKRGRSKARYRRSLTSQLCCHALDSDEL